MHETFWKYFAVISVFTCIAILVVWIFWPYDTFLPHPEKNNTITIENIEEINSETVDVEKENPKLTFLAVGDIMLDRTMLLLAQKHNDFGYAFRMISSTLKNADIRIANLEGPITTNKSISNGEGGARFSFTFSPKTVPPLKENFDVLSLANNHTTNFRLEGLAQTRTFLEEGGIAYFGDPNNQEGNISTSIEKNGITIGLIGYHQLIERGFENVIAEIKKIRGQVDVIIAYPHWGTEYVTTTPTALQKKEAYDMIDAGADIIIGAHPHVIQPIEIYREKLIFYSLGNFVFDQYFSVETSQGLMVRGNLEKTQNMIEVQLELIPVHINKQSQPVVAESSERQEILESVARVSSGTETLQEQVTNGRILLSLPIQNASDMRPMK